MTALIQDRTSVVEVLERRVETVLGFLGDNHSTESVPSEFVTPNEKQAFRDFGQVCNSGNAGAVQSKLFAWGKTRFPAIESIQDLAREINSEMLFVALVELEQSLYAPSNSSPAKSSAEEASASQTSEWQGHALLSAVTAFRQEKAPQTRKAFLKQSLNPA